MSRISPEDTNHGRDPLEGQVSTGSQSGVQGNLIVGMHAKVIAPPTHDTNHSHIILPSTSTNEINAIPDDQAALNPSTSSVVIPLRTNENTSSLEFPDITVDIANDDEEYFDEPETPLSEDPSPTRSRPTKVRFRSRVRITSGINRRRKVSEDEQQRGYLTFKTASSSSSDLSGSPSSSISAPLRTHAQEEVGKPGWGTLGQRVSMFARGYGPQGKKGGERRSGRTKGVRSGRREVLQPVGNEHNERTPLMSAPLARSQCQEYEGQALVSDEELELRIARETDKVFGPWPNRLMNHHWWWWQLEPLVCCHCLTESDEES
ncbi:hypothetical protein CPC08DRAFT_9571 [Agrocybe pediades]|nr:hypothetical protein CPC08DRAFT_9571 [Agrocybe pediades]